MCPFARPSVAALLVSAALLLAQPSLSQSFQWEELEDAPYNLDDEDAVASGSQFEMGCNDVLAMQVNWDVVTVGFGSFVPYEGDDYVSYDDGTFGAHTGYLNVGFDNSSKDTRDYVTLTLQFNQYIEDLEFGILDIDTGSWDDGIEVGYNVPPADINDPSALGTNIFDTGGLWSYATGSPSFGPDNESYMDGVEGYGTSVPANSADGNMLLDFSGVSGGVENVRIRYFSTDDEPNNPGGQRIGISDLEFTCPNLTDVLITDVRRLRDADGSSWVEWDTAWQAQTAGFYLHRWDTAAGDWQRLHEEMLSTLERPDGGLYAVAVPSDLEGWTLVEEVLFDGTSQYYGPYEPREVEAEPGRVQRSVREGQAWSEPRPLSARERSRLRAVAVERTAQRSADGIAGLASARAQQSVAREAGSGRLRIDVAPGSVVGVPLDEIASRLGISGEQAAEWSDSGFFDLRHRGEPVAWTELDGKLVFYAVEEEPSFSAASTYWLSSGHGVTMGRLSGAAPEAGPASLVGARRKFEQDSVALLALPHASTSDLYFWRVGPSNGSVIEFSVLPPDRQPGTPIEVAATMTGTALPPGSRHVVTASVGGRRLDAVGWKVDEPVQRTFEIPANVLDGFDTASLGLSTVIDGEGSGGVFYDSLEVAYIRPAHASRPPAPMGALESAALSAHGFRSDQVTVLDLSEELGPAIVQSKTAAVGSSGWAVAFEATEGARYLAFEPSDVVAPLSLSVRDVDGFWEGKPAAEYVVVAPAEWTEVADELADLRRGRWDTLVVPAEEIYDRFADGAADPEAIRSFLLDAQQRWGTAPRFLAILGSASYDRKDVGGLGGNVVPTFFVRSPSAGLAGSDAPFADLDGDRVPDVAVGRIPALSPGEARAYVAKIEKYEQTVGGPSAALLADDSDGVNDFASASRSVRSLLDPSAEAVTYTFDPERPTDLLRGLRRSYRGGIRWANYFGHAGFSQLAAENILDLEDVPTLTGPTLPVVTALTCTIGRFEVPGYTALAEGLVLEPDAGALAVWATSSLSLHHEAVEMAEAFVAAQTAGEPLETMGDAVREGLRLYAEGSPVPFMQSIYSLLGDPAVPAPLAP